MNDERVPDACISHMRVVADASIDWDRAWRRYRNYPILFRPMLHVDERLHRDYAGVVLVTCVLAVSLVIMVVADNAIVTMVHWMMLGVVIGHCALSLFLGRRWRAHDQRLNEALDRLAECMAKETESEQWRRRYRLAIKDQSYV